jgi:hypothetical protein
MLKTQALLLPLVLALGLISGCAPVDRSYNQDNPPGPPVWPAPSPLYQTPRQYGGAPYLDLGYYEPQPRVAESTSPSGNGPIGPAATGSSTAAAQGDIR